MGLFTSVLKKVAPYAVDPYSGTVHGMFDRATTQAAHPELDLSKFEYSKGQYTSMVTYPEQWHKYQAASYKNPRQAEANQYGGVVKGGNGLEIKLSEARSTKTVGTGVATTGSLNPFGTLDAGLNI